MTYNDDELRRIFRRTSGKCHICHRKLAYKNYNNRGARGAWNVEHSKARARGGTDHGNNLYAACIECNADKGTQSARSARAANGKRHKPMSPEQRARKQRRNMAAGAVAGATAGGLVGGVPGALVGGALGALAASGEPRDE